jgi:hypothetical protein
MFQGQIGPKLGKTPFSEPSIQYFLIFTLDCATLRSLIKSAESPKIISYGLSCWLKLR